jgi:hypothetical protein
MRASELTLAGSASDVSRMASLPRGRAELLMASCLARKRDSLRCIPGSLLPKAHLQMANGLNRTAKSLPDKLWARPLLKLIPNPSEQVMCSL